MTLLSTRVPFSGDADIPGIVVRGCGRFATLAPAIDEVLACIVEGRKVPPAKRVTKSKPASEPIAWGESIVPPFTGIHDGSPWSTATEERGEISVSRQPDGTLRILVGPKSRHGYHAVLRCRGLPFEKGRAYRAAFTARAENDYRIAGGFHQAEKPFLTVGFFPGLRIPTEWQTFTWDFVAERDEPDTRLSFALGKQPNTAWLRDISVLPAAST